MTLYLTTDEALARLRDQPGVTVDGALRALWRLGTDASSLADDGEPSPDTHPWGDLPADPMTWNRDDLARYLAVKSSVPESYARDVIDAILDKERTS